MTKISANPSRNTELKLPIFKKRKKGSLVERSAVYFTSNFFIQYAGRTDIYE